MPILDFFRKTPKGPSVNVSVWVNQAAKDEACIKMAQNDKALTFVAWSKVTYQYFHEVFSKQEIPNKVVIAKDVLPSSMVENNFIFLERHYDLDKEKKFLESFNSKEVSVHVSLDDPLLSSFNIEPIKEMLNKMGHKESEHIEHELINKSIEKAMKKIMHVGLTADSSNELREWMQGMI